MSLLGRAAVFVGKTVAEGLSSKFSEGVGEHIGDALGTIMGRKINPENDKNENVPLVDSLEWEPTTAGIKSDAGHLNLRVDPDDTTWYWQITVGDAVDPDDDYLLVDGRESDMATAKVNVVAAARELVEKISAALTSPE